VTTDKSEPNARRPAEVRAWHDQVIIPTYPQQTPERSPMFLEKRVYQGSSGRVYPNPVTDRVSDEKTERSWQAIHLENEFVRLMILPEIGGRIHVGQDLTNGYDFFYRQPVIKPALVGLLGPWISGGVEFNWAQHHRPSTFMPVDWSIEAGADGSQTVFLSEHEPMGRLKGMVGIRLRPGRSYVEAEARLYNRTPLVQTFLWWANVGVRVHDRYEVFFPQDVWYVADHAKRAMSSFPMARGPYYGVDYGANPEGGTDLRWYRNIPVPTSYMAMGSRHDFFGGYDHAAEAGFVHVADHHVAPGKKLWTWGNHEFGHAWDRNLTDEGGPYVELMAGVYSDNQPDFSFLQPFETKTFRQYWYPIRSIGPATLANLEVAASLRLENGMARIGVAVTGLYPGATVWLGRADEPLLERHVDLAPDAPLVTTAPILAGTAPGELWLRVMAADGRELLSHVPEVAVPGELPPPASEPSPPAGIASNDELYLTGLHLEQYRHATRSPEPYWREALRRDPGDTRANTALGAWHLKRGEFVVAEEHFRTAIGRLTRLNPNPYDGEPLYLLGVVLRHQGRDDEAYDAFAKACWNLGWAAAGYHALAEIDAAGGRWTEALQHLARTLRLNADDLKARDLRAAVLRHTGSAEAAHREAEATLDLDPLDLWATLEQRWAAQALGRPDREVRVGDLQAHLDVALDLASAGLWDDALGAVAAGLRADSTSAATAIAHYHLGWLHERAGHPAEAAGERSLAAGAERGAAFASRLEELAILESAALADPLDARARYELGNLLYDRRRHEEAIAVWERAAELDPDFPVTWRNLGIAYFNIRHRGRRAEAAYRRAFQADPRDARTLYEWDQLKKRMGRPAAQRLAYLERYRDLVDQRDDLGTELATLYNDLGRYRMALDYIGSRRFHPWEGGEGLISGQYVRAHLRLAQAALVTDRPKEARGHLDAAMRYPENLGEGKHLSTPEHELHYYLGRAFEALGAEASARLELELAADPVPSRRPPMVPVPLLSEATYWRALALERLGDADAAHRLLGALRVAARQQADAEVRIDYFATSLPTFLLFEDDLARRNRAHSRYLEGLADLGLGSTSVARAAFDEVLRLDPSHAGARWALDQSAGGRDDDHVLARLTD
jgi:tetratricopeptide (TPR) repeat protein